MTGLHALATIPLMAIGMIAGVVYYDVSRSVDKMSAVVVVTRAEYGEVYVRDGADVYKVKTETPDIWIGCTDGARANMLYRIGGFGQHQGRLVVEVFDVQTSK